MVLMTLYCVQRTTGVGEDENWSARRFDGKHSWHVTSHARPTYCNVCRDQLPGREYFCFHWVGASSNPRVGCIFLCTDIFTKIESNRVRILLFFCFFSGMTFHGLSCEVCKMKTHKHCASKILATCKWTTLASMGKHIMEESDGVSGKK